MTDEPGIVPAARDKQEWTATNLLAKHDENYVQRELEGLEGHQNAPDYADTVAGLD